MHGALEIAPVGEVLGDALPRRRLIDGRAIRFQARILALPERGRTRQRQQCGQKRPHVVHHLDARVVVLDAHMHMQAVDNHAPAEAPEALRDLVVARRVAVMLMAPARKRMRGGGHWREAMQAGPFGDLLAHIDQLGAGVRHRGVHAGADLNLRAHELGAEAVTQPGCQVAQQFRRRLGGEAARGDINEAVFFLDAERESRSATCHGKPPWFVA